MRAEYDAGALRARKKRTLLASAIIFFLIPLTILAGIVLLRDRQYLPISLLLIFYSMVPFFLVFEKRKPKVREIVMIGILAALTAAANLLSIFMTPFQPATAMVILAGIALGPEAGFLIGALARLTCNLFVGNGAWTPWQMFCWGLLGFLSGLVFNKIEPNAPKSRSFQIVTGPVLTVLLSILVAFFTHRPGSGIFWGWKLYAFGAVGLLLGLLLQRKRLPIDDLTLSLYGFMVTFLLYGGIMNLATMVIASAIPASGIQISAGSLAVLYISGAPYDAVHGFGTAFFMFAFGQKMIGKIERVKIKYGFYL